MLMHENKQVGFGTVDFTETNQKIADIEAQLDTSNMLIDDYYFAGKSLQFFGDSILIGVGVDNDTSGMNLTNTRWATKFCELVSATEINDGISGSLYCSGHNDVISISDTVKSTPLTGDYLFLCGGINDWQLGVPLDEFEETIDDLFKYIKENYFNDVFVLAPVNAIKNLVGAPITSIQKYRLILKKYAIKYGFNFINGGNFSLSPTRHANRIIMYQYADGLHPSGFGHYLIAYELLFAFTNLSWESLLAGGGEIVFSGKYLPALGVPMWKMLVPSIVLPPNSNGRSVKLLSNKLNIDNSIIQSANGCFMQEGGVHIAFPGNDENDFKICEVFVGGDGLNILYGTNYNITNGNMFVEFIRYFDINNAHSF